MTNKKFGLSLVLALVFASCSKAGNVSSYQPFLSTASNGTVVDAPSSSNSSDITGGDVSEAFSDSYPQSIESKSCLSSDEIQSINNESSSAQVSSSIDNHVEDSKAFLVESDGFKYTDWDKKIKLSKFLPTDKAFDESLYTRSTNTSDILTTYETDTMFAFIHSVTHDEKCDGQGLPYIPNTSDIEEFKTEYRGYKYKNVGVNKDRYGLVISSTTRTCVEALDGKRWNVSISYSEYGLTNGYLSGKAYLPASFIANDGESLLDNIYAEETYFDYRMVPGKDQEMSFNLQLNLKYKTNAENNPYYGNMLSYLGDDGGYTFATMYVIIEYTAIKEGYTTTYTGHIEREDADAVLGTVLENYLPCLGIYDFDYNLNKINNTPFTDVPTTI